MKAVMHTKGPWIRGCHYGIEERETIQILSDDTGTPNERTDDIDNVWVVADVNCCMGSESAANANLISAAPELLEALEQAMAVVEDFLPNIGHCALQDYGRLNAVLIGAPKAIAKARGGK